MVPSLPKINPSFYFCEMECFSVFAPKWLPDSQKCFQNAHKMSSYWHQRNLQPCISIYLSVFSAYATKELFTHLPSARSVCPFVQTWHQWDFAPIPLVVFNEYLISLRQDILLRMNEKQMIQ